MNRDRGVDLPGLLARELARTPRGLWVTCAGRSMEPTIRMGDRVLVRTCERVRPGDVVLFQGTRGLVLHRVLFPLPGTRWFLHIGDAGSGDGPGLAARDTLIGRAEIACRLLPFRDYARSLGRLSMAAYRVLVRDRYQRKTSLPNV